MKQTIFIILGIIALIVVVGVTQFNTKTLSNFWVSEKTLEDKLTAQPKLFRIDIDEEAKFPHSINLRLSGQVNGSAIVGYGWTDTSMNISDTISGNFNLDFDNDWYSDSCFVQYHPLTATRGIIKIDSKIFSSKK